MRARNGNVGAMEWPERFYELRRGEGCPMGAEGRPDETLRGIRVVAGEVADAYLQRPGIQRGYTVVIWRGRHVAERAQLDEDEASQYWREVLHVGRALETTLEPVKLNYDVLGNSLPHLHTHVIPRFADDPKPGWPFPFPEDDPGLVNEKAFRRDLEALR